MNKIAGRRICLIGGAGFIGHNLALALRAMGAEVSIIDSLQINNLFAFVSKAQSDESQQTYLNMLNERLNLLKSHDIPLHIQDARDYHSLGHTLKQIKPQVVVKLAAVAHANKSNKDPFSTFDHSLRTLENALDWARHVDVEHFVYFSSSMVYGNFVDGSVDETTVCEPLGIYGALKFAGEKMVIAYNQVFDLPYTIVRPSALYGERCVSRRVAQIFVENAINSREIVVNGDGSDSLDFTYIGDLVNGIKCVINSDNALGEIFNLTHGKGRSISELAELVKSRYPHVHVRYSEKDNLTPSRGTLSIEKAKELIDYRPEWPLERGLLEYMDWYESREIGQVITNIESIEDLQNLVQ